MATYKIKGFVTQGYRPVREQFEKNFIDGREKCAQLCVYVGEEKVVDLWGSVTGAKEYDGDTITNVFSSAKSLTAICMATLVDKNLMDYEDKVIQHWPEFGNGDKDKEKITIADILTHEGGLASLSEKIRLVDVQRENIKKNSIGSVIEKEPLRFPPTNTNSKAEYHVVTRGWILNEIFRRIDPQHRTIGECLRDEISIPLNVDCYIGLELEQLKKLYEVSFSYVSRVVCASFVPTYFGRTIVPNLFDLMQMLAFAPKTDTAAPIEMVPLRDVTGLLRYFEASAIRMGEIPSSNGQCSARGLAKIAAMMVNGGKIDGKIILSEETCDKFHSCNEEPKRMAPRYNKVKFSQGGVNNYLADDDNYWLSERTKLTMRNRAGYIGWMGIGGSVFQWNLDYKVGFAYVPTFLAWEDLNNTRAALLQKIVIDCTKALSKSSLENNILDDEILSGSTPNRICVRERLLNIMNTIFDQFANFF